MPINTCPKPALVMIVHCGCSALKLKEAAGFNDLIGRMRWIEPGHKPRARQRAVIAAGESTWLRAASLTQLMLTVSKEHDGVGCGANKFKTI